MLHRSFKGAKCKTSLKLAVARIKLLRNKREVQLRHMRKELAQLLESGQDRTARIRVEHVVREEKTVAAYDLVEIYCELLVARLPIIESQKNCPIDLKEAVSSIIFAAPRCADVPELQDIRKHLTTKYGKDFITSALELRPECGVSRMLVEKLSATAPNVDTKVKILTAIAQEHNVQWDPTSFEKSELKPQEDLLNVPSVMAHSSQVPPEPRTAQTPYMHGQNNESHMNFKEHISGSSWSSQTSGSTNTTTSANTHTSHANFTEPRATATPMQRKEFECPPSKNANMFSPSEQDWNNMEFKDAAAAAQAAAESADRASRAARAAAELSINGNLSRQHLTESHKSSFAYGYKEESGKSTDPRLKKDVEDLVRTVDDLSRSSSMEMHHQKRHGVRTDSMGLGSDNNSIGNRSSSHKTYSGTSVADIKGTIPEINLQKKDGHSQTSSSDDEAVDPKWQNRNQKEGDVLGQSSVKKECSQYELDPEHYEWDSRNAKYTNFGEDNIRRQSSSSASSYSSRTGYNNDDAQSDSYHQKYGNDSGKEPVDSSHGSMKRQTQSSYNDIPPVVFDDYGSDNDTNMDVEEVYTGHKSDMPSAGKKSHDISENVDTWSSRHRIGSLEDQSNSELHFHPEPYSQEPSERTKVKVVPFQTDDLMPAAFDEYDSQDSENEWKSGNVNLSKRTDSTQKQTSFTRSTISTEAPDREPGSAQSKKTTGIVTRPWLHSSDDSESDDAYGGRNLERKYNVNDESGDLPSNQLSSRQTKSLKNSSDDLDQETWHRQVLNEQSLHSSRTPLTKGFKSEDTRVASGSPDIREDTEISNDSSSEVGKELKLGRLTGGFRNKGYIRPPYHTAGSVGTPLAGQKAIEDNPPFTEQPVIPPTVRTSINSEGHSKEPSQQKPYNQKMSSRIPRADFDSDSDDTEVLTPQTVDSRNHMSGRRSHRTKNSLGPSDATGASLSTSGSKAQVTSDKERFYSQAVQVTSDDERSYLPINDANEPISKPREKYEPFQQKPYNQNMSSRIPRADFDSDSDDTEVLTPQTVDSRNHMSGRRSHRTKNSLGPSDAAGASLSTSGSKAQVTSDKERFYSEAVQVTSDGERSYSPINDATEPISKPQTKTVSTGSRRTPMSRTGNSVEKHYNSQSRTRLGENLKLGRGSMVVEEQSSKPEVQTEVSVHEESARSSRSSSVVVEQSSNPPPKTKSTASAKASGSNEESISRDNSLKKAGHVHPKLPDYDTLAAHFASLRSNK